MFPYSAAFSTSHLMISGDIVPNNANFFLVGISTGGLADIFLFLSIFINFLIRSANSSPVNSCTAADYGWCQSSQPRPNTRNLILSFISSFLPLMLVIFLSSLSIFAQVFRKAAESNMLWWLSLSMYLLVAPSRHFLRSVFFFLFSHFEFQ